MKGEQTFIKEIKELAERLPPDDQVLLQLGDDAAAIYPSPEHALLVSTDALVEHVHFNLSHCAPKEVGQKALAVNLSDIAAMGGRPLGFTVSLSIPQRRSQGFIGKFYQGLLQMAELYEVTLLGGDTCSSPGPIFVNITIFGETRSGEMLTRKEACPGDFLFVTGKLGASAMGLELLRSRPHAVGNLRPLVERHLCPFPRNFIGRWLAQNQYASALIDISDGLSTDLHHLCMASKVGAVIDSEKLPLVKVDSQEALLFKQSPLDYGLHGGEDYELLFTVTPEKKGRIPLQLESIPFHEIGRITDELGKCYIEKQGLKSPLLPLGFDHFGEPSSMET